MALNDNLSIGFKCGNLNSPNAQKTYFPKPEKIDLRFELIVEDERFELIVEDDQKFQEFQVLFRSEIYWIKLRF